MERISSSEVNGGSPSPSSSVSFSSWVPNTATERGVAQSQAMTSVPPMALGPTSSELSLSSSNCPNCKLLNRYLRVSREWNNFFRLKLDQRDTLLHIAADYKRQKQQSLQLQMSLDQQSRECNEMREQLTNLLLEVKPLRERLQIAEQRVEEEAKQREKAESEKCNLQFLLEQQTHRIKDLENRDLSSVLEKKLNTLQARVKRLKIEDTRKSRTECELREAASLAQEREVRNLKKAHWGLSLAYKYGRSLLNQDKFPEGNSPKEEWSSLQNILKQVLQNLDQQYLAYCRKLPFHSLMEDWLNDFHNEDWQDRDAYGVESEAKQLERLIQDDNEEKISEGIMEEEKMIKAKQVKKTETKLEQRGSQDSCEGQHTISRYKENTSLVHKHEPENDVLSSRDQGEVTVVSILDSSIESIDSDPLPSLHNNVEATPHMVDTEIRKEAQEPIRSASIKKVQQPIKSSSTKTTQDLMISPPIKTQEPIELTSIKKTQESVKSVSLLDTSMEDSDSDVLPRPWNSTENTAIRKKEQELMKSPIRKAQESVKSTSLLDTNMEDSDSDVLPRPQNGTEVKASRTGIRKKMQESIKSPSIRKTRELTKMTSILDTSMEDSDIDILPSLQSSTEVTAPCTENTRIQRKMQQPIKSPIRKTQKPIKSASLLDTSMEDSDSEVLPSLQNGVEKTISHTVDTGIRKKTQDISKSLSILDTSLEDSDEEPSLRPLASTTGHSFDVNLKGTEELPMVTSLKRDHSNSYAGTSKETSPINSYHLDEELRAILQKMRPHKKLEDIDTSLSGGPSPLPETGMPVPAMKQDFLGSLSDSEEEEKDEEKEMHEQDKAGMCVIPRILTTQISEEFVARSHKGSSLLDDLDISTDTIDQEREDEKEEKDNQTQVPLPHFQSSQSFSFDMEECHPLPSPQTLASMSGEISKEQHTHCQSQLPQSVDGDDNSMCGHQGDVPKVQNKVLLKEMRHLFGAVDDTTTVSGRETEDSDHQSVGSAGKNDVLSMSGGAIHTELCQEGQASPDIQITENKLVEDIVNGSRSTAAQKEMNKEKEERSTEIEEENNGAALEGKNTEGMEKITIRADEDKTIAVKDRMEGDVDTVLTEREEQTTETAETRGKEVRGGFTETAEESTEAEEDRITVEKEERTTPLEQERTTGKEKKISEGEKERNIFVNDMKNSEIEKQRTSKAQEGRIKDNEGNTENEDERTTETEQERTTRTEDERNDKNDKNGAAEEEEERTIEAVKEICTGIAEKGSLEVEKDQTGQDEEKVEDANDGTQETDTGKTIGEDVNTIEIEEIGTTLPEKEQTTEEEEKKTPQNKKRNPPQRKRRRSLRILDMLRKEIQEEEEEEGEKERRNTDEEMERGHWTKRLSRQKKKDCGLDEEIQKEGGQKSRQCIQRQLKAKTEEPHLVGGKGNRRKVEGMQETEEHNGEKIWDDKQKRWKERKRESEQEEESNKEDQGKERKQEEEKMKREMEKRRKQEKKTNQEKEKNEGIEQEKEEKKIMPENERKRRKSKRVQDEDKTLREEEEERKMKEEEERKIKEEEERKMKEERKRKMKEEEERKMKEEKERKIKEEEERKMKEERERKMKEEEERKMKEEKERKMKEEKERKMKEERERKIKEEEERKMKEEKERKMKEEKERKIKEEEERKIKEEEERKMKEEKERKMKEEEERKMKEEKERKMKEEKERKMKEEEERKMKEERKRKMKEEEERKMKEERERKMKEEEERKMKEEKKRKMKEEKERKIKEEEERKIKEEEERKMKEEEARKMKEKEKRWMKEIEERKIKGKEERKTRKQKEMERKILEDKGKRCEQKRKREEESELCNNTEEKLCELESKQRERKKGETEIQQQEEHKRLSGVSVSNIENSACGRGSDIKASQKETIRQTHPPDNSKKQEKIVFSWCQKRRQWRKFIKFHRMSRLTRVLPDPLGSLHHSVFVMECRVDHRSAQEQTNRKSTSDGWLVKDPPLETSDVHISCGQEREKGKENNRARDSMAEKIPAVKIKTSSREQKIKEKMRHLWDEQTCRGKKAVTRKSKRISKIRDSSNSSSDRNRARNKSSSSNSRSHSRNRDRSSSRNRDESNSSNSSSRNGDRNNSSSSRSRSNIRNRDRSSGSSSNSRSHSRNRDRSSSRNRDKSNSSSSSRNIDRNNSSSSIRNKDRSRSNNSSSSSRNRDRSSSRNRDRSRSSSSSSSSIRNRDRNNSSRGNRNRDRSSSISSRSSSSSSFTRETMCTVPREVQSLNRAPQQPCGLKKNAKTDNLGALAKPYKTRTSKGHLFGIDSDNSCSSEEKGKEQVKKNRKDEEDEQQEPPAPLHNKRKNFRSSLLVATKVGGKRKSIKQPQLRRSRRFSSSYSSLPACQTMYSSEEELASRRGHHSSDPETDLSTSDSGVPHYPASSKCRPMVIESEDEDSQDDAISGVYLRRKRRKRKMDGGSGSQVSDNHNSSAEQKRYLTSPCLTPDPHTACRVIQNKKHMAVDEESPEARYLVHSKSTPSITSLALKRKASKTLIAQQGKYTLAAEKREHHEISSNCREMSSFSSKQQNKVKPPILKRHQTSPSIPELSTSFQSINKRGKSVDCIEQDQLRSPIKHEQDKTREESMITSPSKERKHTILLENPPHPSKRCKRNSPSWDPTSRHQKEQKLDDSSDTSDNIDEADRVDDNKDTLVLSQLDNDTNLQPHDGDALKISGDESEIQMMSESHDPDMIDALILPRSDSDSEDEMVVEENTSNCIGSSKENAPKSSESASQTQVTATTRSQECQMLRLSHLGPVALFDQPRFRKKPAPAPMPTAMQTPIPAGPEYVEKLFSSLHQRIERSSVDLTQNSHATQPQGTINSRAAGTASLSQTCLNQPVRGIDYQGQSPVLLPNMYGTLQPVPATEKPKPISRNNPSLCTPGHSWEAPHSALPGSSHVVSSTEQIQPNPTYNHPNPVAEKLHNTFGTSQVTPLQPQASHNQNPQYSYASVPNCSLQQMPWLPKIRPERVTHGKQQETLAIEDLEEALEEVLATRLCSKWWVMGLQQLCASINTKILPYFLRLVLKCIMCADPLEPQKHPNSLPPKLYRLFQVVCIMEQRLTPHHPRGLHNALLRAIQAIISKPDIKITLHSLASLTAWYIASASIDGQAKAGQEWRRARTFLVDLLFHHPGAIHLALLTAATTSYRIFCKFMQHRVMSGLEQVVVWLAHYGAWVGQPGVRSDLTKWLAQHLKVKKPPQSPAPLIKNLVTLLDPEKKRDLQWGAATSIVVLARWQGWAWTREHLLPPLLTAAGEISMAVSQQEESCNRDLELNEDFNIKISHLFDNLSQALPCGPEEKDYDDIVEKMKNAVTSIFCSSPSANCNILTT